ncbi:MAG TPA: hypothetical protein VD926_04535 [Acidimicrobiales bacterium]|nr:hypothetical protein [Acidimicrobiales bacterium]
MGRDQRMKPGHPIDAFREPGPLEAGSLVVFDEHIVMGLSPVMTYEHPAHHNPLVVGSRAEATSSSLMVQCSQHVIPPAVQVDLTDQQAHDLVLELNALRSSVLTRQRLGTILTPTARTVEAH